MFQTPALVLSILIASICATLFYIWKGKALRQFAAYWIGGVIGFLAGQAVAIVAGFRFLVIGQVHLIEGILLCAGALFLVKRIRL